MDKSSVQDDDKAVSTSRVFVVIPVHNRREQTLSCLRDLSAQTHPALTTIVVDDGSRDGTNVSVRQQFPATILLEGDGNLWWTAATNRGVEFALANGHTNDFVLTLNDDTHVEPRYVATLLETAASHPQTLVGSLVVYQDRPDIVCDGGTSLSWWTAKHTPHARGLQLDQARRRGRLVSVDMLSGRGTLIPLAAYRAVGLYDEVHLPHYAADYEFSVRAQRRGFHLLLDYDAVVVSAAGLTGLNNEEGRLPWRDLARSFFTRRSAYQLAMRYQFARLCAPRMLFAPFLVLDTCRLIGGRLRNQFRRRSS
jgi:GT2 family glycosyltransferase